jgi:replication-associated recombination protein RarA
VAISAWDCFTRVGPAEGERAIAQAIVYLACAPKSALPTSSEAIARQRRATYSGSPPAVMIRAYQ